MSRVVGIDPAQNHIALVCLDDGELVDYAFMTDYLSHSKTHDNALHLPVEARKKTPEGRDKHRLVMWRLAAVADFVWKYLALWTPGHVAVEDYALRAEHGAHQMGEVGGVIRWMLFKAGIPFRLHDPTSLKMFIAHDGTCQKDSVERAVKERFGVDYSKHNAGTKSHQTSEDLADAHSLAYMCHIEVEIRAGRMKVSDLDGPKEIRVFNRITKYQPVPLVDREWIEGV